MEKEKEKEGKVSDEINWKEVEEIMTQEDITENLEREGDGECNKISDKEENNGKNNKSDGSETENNENESSDTNKKMSDCEMEGEALEENTPASNKVSDTPGNKEGEDNKEQSESEGSKTENNETTNSEMNKRSSDCAMEREALEQNTPASNKVSYTAENKEEEDNKEQSKSEGSETENNETAISDMNKRSTDCAMEREAFEDRPDTKEHTSSSDEDEKPLIYFKRQLFDRNNSESEDDDIVKDPTFEIKGKDIYSSDSDDHTDMKEVRRIIRVKRKLQIPHKETSIKKRILSSVKNRIAKPEIVRNKNWKKSPTNLSRKKRIVPGRPNKSNNASKTPDKSYKSALNKALNESRTLYELKQQILTYHKNSLDALLFSNGLKRKVIEGDGNCFFAAMREACNLEEDITEIRRKCCNYMMENINEFMPFFEDSLQNNEELSKERQLREKIENLQNNGVWNLNNLADALPMAAANVYNVEIFIYTSRRNNPLLEVQPFSKATKSACLAYLSVSDAQHYDVCVPIENTEKSVPTTPLKTCSPQKNETTPKRKSSSEFPDITPRKQARYVSPKRNPKMWKRKSNPLLWKKNVRKNLRLKGKEYLNTVGKTVQAKQVLNVSCKCRYKCTESITEADRELLFNSYWELDSFERKKDFLCSCILENTPERVRTSARSHRKVSREFYFTVNEKRVRVCKTFFVKTLNIGTSSVETALKNKSGAIYTKQDQRGRHTPHNKTPKMVMGKIKEHIESFPVMDPHYTRKDTQRKFLGNDLSITKMYSLYKEKCTKEGRKAAGPSVYRKVFCEDYNFSFHQPKKDQCQNCTVYSKAVENNTVSDEMKETQEQHIKRKQNARHQKDSDKHFAKSHPDFHAATFDLEAVQPIPCSNVSQVYYKRKLNCYNLSFYSLGNAKGTCYLWNETEGKRGSNEIATCLILYMKGLPSVVSHVCFFSDSCGGQNRNRFVSTALLHAVCILPNIRVIEQKYLETGHTQMECDSMHAAIEHSKKDTPIYVPSEFDTVVRKARRNNKYFVVPLKHQDFQNFKDICLDLLPQGICDTDGKPVQWRKICWFQYRKADTDQIFFKYSFEEDEFHTIRVKKTKRGRTLDGEMPRCYRKKLPISDLKKKDLLTLCKDGVIPEDYHAYYENMPSDKSVKEKLPTPDAYEDSDMDSD